MKGEDAISNVIGAVMVMALVVITLVTVQTQYTPVWELRKEIEQADEVFNSFARLKADIDQQVGNETRVPITVPLPLGTREDGRFIQTGGTRAEVRFEPDGRPMNLSAPAMNLFRQDGRRLGILSEDWKQSGGNSTVSDIKDVESLRIRLTAPPGLKLEFKPESYVRLTLHDEQGDFAGEYRVYVPEKDKHDIWGKVETSSGNILFDQEIMPDAKFKEHATVWIDVLDPSLPFKHVLDAVEAPYSFTLGYDFPQLDPAKWPDVEYAASYTTVTAEGEELFVGGMGTQTISNFVKNYQAGRLVYTLNSARMPSQTLVYEHGAVLRVQDTAAAMIIEPNLFLRTAGSYTLLDGTVPSLGGKQSAVDRTGSTGVSVRGGIPTSFIGTAAEFSVTVTTDYPQAWREYFEDLARDAGLGNPDGYEVDEQATTVTFTVKGTAANPSTHDLQVNFRRAPVTVALGA